jgi:hypothetical protein
MDLKRLFFFQLDHFLEDMKHSVSTRFLTNRIVAVAICLKIIGAQCNILLFVNAKIIVLMTWSYRSPQLC